MTIEELDARIAPQLPNVVLSPATFQQEPGLTGLLQQYFSDTNGEIAIAGVDKASYEFDPAAGAIRFSGLGAGGPFDRMPLSGVAITVVAGVPRLAIDGKPPAGWTLSQSFPELDSPILAQLAFQDAALYWASFDDDYHSTGFYLEASVDFTRPPLSFLGLLFPQPGSIPIWGGITMEGSTGADFVQFVPTMRLTSQQSETSVTLGPFALARPHFKIFGIASFNVSTREWQTHSKVRISTFLQFQESWFQFIVDADDPANDLLFRAVFDAPLGAKLTELADFVGITGLDVPGFSLQHPDDLMLKDVKVAVDPDGKQKIKLVAIEIGTSPMEKFPLWNDVYLENIGIVFQLIPGATGYVVEGEISGQIGDWLLLQAGFASDRHYTFSGELLNDVSLAEVYKFFTGHDLADLPDVEVGTLDFTLDRPADGGVSYSAEITIDTKWPIVTEPVSIELDGLTFTINHTAGENTSVTASGVLGLSDYSVGLEADYDSSSGWMFDGTVEAEQGAATLADVIARIEKTLHLDTSTGPGVPPFLTDWLVETLSASFATESKNFDFTVTVGNRAVPSLALGFGVHLEHSPASFTRTFTADARVTTATFAVDVSGTVREATSAGPPPSKTFTLTGAYSATTPPRLSDLVAWAAGAARTGASLPAEIQIDATATDVAVQIEQIDQQPQTVEVAGAFALKVRSSVWNLYFTYTNAASFTPDGARALVDGQPVYVLGAAIGGLVDLSRLPLVGRIPGISTLRIDKIGFFYTNARFSSATPALHFDVPAIGSPSTLAPDATAAVLTEPGFNLMAVFGNAPNASGTGVNPAGTMPLPLATGQPAPGQPPVFAQMPAAAADPVSWLALNKVIGPFALQKIGLGYEKATRAGTLGTIAFYLDATFTIAGLALVLDRLGVSIDVPNPKGGVSFNPIEEIRFHLGGMFVDYQAPDLQISGGFVTLPGGSADFIGEFGVMAGEFGLQAYGGFSNAHADPSLFIFVHVEVPIGGPPFLFVNGLAGGFGVNRAFVLPTFDQLLAYPFLPASPVIPTRSQLTGDGAAQLAAMTQALTALSRYVPVRHGEYWLAAGLDVSSFHMIEVSAVLSAEFGVEFRLGIVGSASMTFPVAEPQPIAYVQIDFEVAISPSHGTVAAFGKITPASFLYSGLVHLSGGFAFATWFGGPNRGNYVATIGGYNLQYKRPPIYPDVPRLQATFGIDSLNAAGDAYFALVPHALMAGIDIHATWSLGSLDAWFDAGLDFLLNWKPFHYHADGRIAIGVSLTIKVLFVHVRITVHAAVDLDVQGPSFGGRAHVDLDVVSFTIRFGDAPVTRQVGWTDFRAFLPSVDGDTRQPPVLPAADGDRGNQPLVNATASEGLLKSFAPGETREGLHWLVDANHFTLTTTSTAPCTRAAFNAVAALEDYPRSEYLDPRRLTASVAAAIDRKQTPPYFAYHAADEQGAWNTRTFGVVPLGHRSIRSKHTVTVQALDANGKPGPSVDHLVVILQTGNVSRALWGTAGVSATSLQGGQELVDGALTGFTIVPMIWFPKRTTFIASYDLVFDTNDLFVEQARLPSFNTTPFADPAAIYRSMDSGALFETSGPARSRIVSLLTAQGFAGLTLAGDRLIDTGQYLADPLLVYLSDTSETSL